MRKAELAALAYPTPPSVGGTVLCAQEDGDTLVLDIFEEQALCCRYALRKDGSYMTLRNGAWRQERLQDALGLDPYCFMSERQARFRSQRDRATTKAFLSRCFAEKGYADLLSRIADIQSAWLRGKRERAIDRRYRRINTEIMAVVPQLPQGITAWARETVFKGVQYWYKTERADVYACTACGGVHRKRGAKHRGSYRCTRSGETVVLDKVRSSHEQKGYAMVLQRLADGRCIARHVKLLAQWSAGSVAQITVHERCRMFFGKGGFEAVYYGQLHEATEQEQLWFDRNPLYQNPTVCYCYTAGVSEALADTPWAHAGVAEMAAHGWRLHYNVFMQAYRNFPALEYLVKSGLQRLTKEITVGYSSVLGRGSTAAQVLGIDMQRVHRLRQADGGVIYLMWLQREQREGCRIPERAIRFFEQYRIFPSSVDFARAYLSPEQIANYLERQQRELGGAVGEPVTLWRDTLNMAQQLKLPMWDSAVHRPRDLSVQYDRLVARLNAGPAEEQAAAYEKRYPQVAAVIERLAQYAYTDGTYSIVAPRQVADILVEARVLNHCVANERYIERIALQESYILFLRRAHAPDVPWYTLEVEPNGTVRQKRTHFNRQQSDLQAAIPFLKKWQAWVGQVIGERERELAAVSAEKRRTELAELRRKGMVVHGAAENGQLLVDVLLADLMEGA